MIRPKYFVPVWHSICPRSFCHATVFLSWRRNFFLHRKSVNWKWSDGTGVKKSEEFDKIVNFTEIQTILDRNPWSSFDYCFLLTISAQMEIANCSDNHGYVCEGSGKLNYYDFICMFWTFGLYLAGCFDNVWITNYLSPIRSIAPAVYLVTCLRKRCHVYMTVPKSETYYLSPYVPQKLGLQLVKESLKSFKVEQDSNQWLFQVGYIQSIIPWPVHNDHIWEVTVTMCWIIITISPRLTPLIVYLLSRIVPNMLQ